MNEIVNQLAQSLFKKNSLQDCSRWELEILADHYPYFGIAQFLVSGKLQEENAPTYNKQVEKTSLYFTNPLWLDYILNNKTTTPSENVIENKTISESEVTIPPEVTQATTEDIEDDEQIEVIENTSYNTEQHNAEQNFTEQIITEDEIFSPDNEIELSPETIHSLETAADATEAIETTSGEQQESELKIKPFQPEPMPDENAPLFEPFHTVDYFASQGIKEVHVEKPKDRFDQQLKSFTQWLKTIKKVPAAEIIKEVAKESEQKVITLAEHSIEDREVVTEAMAEVWLKQGNREKAIEVYNKLSLQNPAKSAYFAGLIEQLKQP